MSPLKTLNKTSLIAGLFGNAIEWYDFSLYANFAAIIAHLFFPDQSVVNSLLLTFLIFASGFLGRPIGALIFGYIGDRFGRRVALLISICAMAIPTFSMAFLPTFASVGALAPLLLLILRLLQGFAVSGEMNSATTYLVENAASNKRGFAGCLVMCTALFGMLAGATFSTLAALLLSPEALAAWGWRVLFAIGGLSGIIGLILRLRMPESQSFLSESSAQKRLPFGYVFRHYPKKVILSIFLTSIMAVPNYILIALVVTFLVKFGGFSLKEANLINLISLAVLILLVPLAGRLSDRIGRKPLYLAGILTMIIGAWPIFWLLTRHQFYAALAGDLLLSLGLVPLEALIPTMLAEIFPTAVRNSGSAISYNVSLTVFGGTTPLIALELIHLSGNTFAPAYYLIAFGFIAWFSLSLTKESYNIPLPD